MAKTRLVALRKAREIIFRYPIHYPHHFWIPFMDLLIEKVELEEQKERESK